MLRTGLILTSSVLMCATAHAQEEVSYEATELRGGVIMLNSGIAGNVAILSGEDGLLMIDDQLPTTGSVLQAALEEYAGEGVPRFILNTHWHGDHAGGNAHFAPQGSTVAAHHNIRSRIVESDSAWATQDGAAPIVTFGDDLTFHMNGQTVEAVHVPAAHTDGDAMVYFREADVLHMGDTLFSGRFPFIDLNSGGTVDGYIAALERGLEVAGPDTQIIPGHGPLSTEADIEALIAMLQTARAAVGALVEEGMSEDEVVAAGPLADLAEDWDWRFINSERMTRTLYQDANRGE